MVSRQHQLAYRDCFNPRPACRANGSVISQHSPHFAVSIRALRAGRMFRDSEERGGNVRFNPRPACRANACGRTDICPSRPVSIRALRAGRMAATCCSHSDHHAVSIRALRAGRMVAVASTESRDSRFNPRPACRANGLHNRYYARRKAVSIRALRAGRMKEAGR